MKSNENIIEMNAVKYELIVAVNQDCVIGVTDASGNQRLPFTCRDARGCLLR
jgi:hypothetical protein